MIAYFEQFAWLDEFSRIILYFFLAWVVSTISRWIARGLMWLTRFTPTSNAPQIERYRTIQSLLASFISLFVFITAVLLSVGLFVRPDTLVWMVGLFSAAFGLGARPLISDFLSGISFLFEDTFTVGEKVELTGIPAAEGVIESINLRATSLRSPSGELIVVPNGEIRAVRNFSRGKFSLARITIKISAADLGQTLSILEALGAEAVYLLPNLIEPWQLISPDGVTGKNTELTIVAKARFGLAAEMQPRLIKLIHDKLAETGIDLVG